MKSESHYREIRRSFCSGGKIALSAEHSQERLYFWTISGFSALGLSINDHDKLPDVVLLDTKRNWLFLIEAVTSHGPMSPKRVFELEAMLKKCPAGRVYVSAFPDMTEFKKHTKEIAWETEVWIAEMPEHMIHFNGDRFLGPR